MTTPEATLPSIIFFSPESPLVPITIRSALFFSAYSTIAATMDAGVTMTSDLKSTTQAKSLILVKLPSNSDLSLSRIVRMELGV